MQSFRTLINDPSRKGELAAQKQLLGDCNRYAIAPVHTRFEQLAWFVWDAEVADTTQPYEKCMGYPPLLIRIANTYEQAIAGL